MKKKASYVVTVHSERGHHVTALTELIRIRIVKTPRFITADSDTKNFHRLSLDPRLTGTVLMVQHHSYTRMLAYFTCFRFKSI